MTKKESIAFISKAVQPAEGTWADVGAGTGTFTEALAEILAPGSTIYALDKSPHALWRLKFENVRLVVEEADFTGALSLPEEMDGVLVANALHYAENQVAALRNIIGLLRPGGTFILIEYDSGIPRPPWVPYPVTFERFTHLCEALALESPEKLSTRPSQYGHDHMYLAVTRKTIRQ